MSVEISCSLWSLDLLTWVWTKLEPEGEPLLRCDKTACWSYEGKVYIVLLQNAHHRIAHSEGIPSKIEKLSEGERTNPGESSPEGEAFFLGLS